MGVKVAVRAIIEKDGKYLLLKRTQEPEKGKFNMPGGAVERGEDSVDAIVRKVIEETGISIKPRRLFYIMSTVDYKGNRYRNSYFYAKTDEEPNLNDESLEGGYYSRDQIKKMDLAFTDWTAFETHFSMEK